jgi:GNAT superfamily N-acetyltransferase
MNPVATSTGQAATIRARKAIAADLEDVSQALAEAFFDDPVFSWCYPDAARRRQIAPRFFEIVTESILTHDEIYTIDPVVAAAVWIPPGVETDEEMVATLGEVSGEYESRLFTALKLMEEIHPVEPHHYLFLLGTRLEWQSRGIGSDLIRSVLEVCDRDQVPAYLEATSEANRRLYLRHGFEVTGEIQLPDGPTMWRMWRRPDSPEGTDG